MAASAALTEIVGRDQELGRVGDWASGVHAGPSALLVRGEPGIGKSSVWRAAVERAREQGALVLVARPVEPELPLGHAALADLLADTVAPVLGELPDPLGHAVRRALMLEEGADPIDAHAVGRGALLALRALAARLPVVVAVDDAHWLDPASARALAFVARRPDASAVSFAISIREGHDDPLALAGSGLAHDELVLGGLDLEATATLLRLRLDSELPRRVAAGIHRQSGGNPFFALELARAHRAGGAVPRSLVELVELRLADASDEATAAIELAAVLTPAPVSAFSDASALDDALVTGILVEDGDVVRFAHPLLATGAYERVAPARRRELHRSAAELEQSLEARARHLALASLEPDDGVARLLDEAASAACERGAPEAAAELAAHARRLTPVGNEAYVRRTMDEADYLYLAADEPSARTLVDEVLAGRAGGDVRVRALMQRALHEVDPRLAVARLDEAVGEPTDDRRLALRALAQLAWQRGAWLGDVEPAAAEALEAVELADRTGDEQSLVTALTTAGLVLSLAGDVRGDASFRRAIAIADRNPVASGDHTPRLAFAHWRWWSADWQEADALLAAERAEAERRGDDGLLMRIDVLATDVDLRRGNWDLAAERMDALLEQALDYWRILLLSRRAILRARRGQTEGRTDADEVAASALGQGDPVFAATAEFAHGLLDFAEGRVADSAERTERLPAVSDGAGSRAPEFASTIPEVVTTLLEADRRADAERLASQLERWVPQLDPWATASVDLCRGQLHFARAELDGALERLAAARDGFESIGAPWELGQTLLAEGRVLRRSGRRRDAADALESARGLFAALGAEPACRRAADELRRASPRRRSDSSLTEAERRVAVLVADGRTNKEVAAQLFLTVRTVEAHLTRIYDKLGLRSRSELARAVADRRVELTR